MSENIAYPAECTVRVKEFFLNVPNPAEYIAYFFGPPCIIASLHCADNREMVVFVEPGSRSTLSTLTSRCSSLSTATTSSAPPSRTERQHAAPPKVLPPSPIPTRILTNNCWARARLCARLFVSETFRPAFQVVL